MNRILFLVFLVPVIAISPVFGKDAKDDAKKAKVADKGSTVWARAAYVQNVTSNSAVICWRSADAYRGAVRWGTSAAALDHVTESKAVGTYHFVSLQNLEPQTKIYYATYNASADTLLEGGNAYFFTTAPKPGADVPVRFWVVGDSGTANANARAVFNAYRLGEHKKRPADLMLMLGDNAYQAGTDEQYTRSVFDVYGSLLKQIPVYSCIGNHEVDYKGGSDSPTQKGPYYEAHVFPSAGESGGLASGTEAYYAMDYGPVHFIFVDSADTPLTKDHAMYKWAEKDLQQTRQKWIVVAFHHPPYTKGSHDSDNAKDSGGRMSKMRENYLPLFENYGVDLILSGHSHSYERSFLINGHYGTSATFDAKKHVVQAGDGRTDGDGAYGKPVENDANKGTIYIVAGSSGKISGGKLNHPAMFSSHRSLGSLLVDATGNKLNLSFINEKGTAKDYFTIEKQ